MTTDDENPVTPAVDLKKLGPRPETEITEITESAGIEVTDGADSERDDGPPEIWLGADDGEQADVDTAEASAVEATAAAVKPARRRIGFGQSRLVAYIVLPVLAFFLAVAAGLLVWQDISASATVTARADSVQAAKESTVRMLSYKPDTVEAELTSARDLLTGTFKDSYTQLTNEVVIPGAKQKRVAAVASVPAVASVEASSKHAVALVFVNQTVTVGDEVPTATASSVRVTLDKVDGRWLISEFDPV